MYNVEDDCISGMTPGKFNNFWWKLDDNFQLHIFRKFKNKNRNDMNEWFQTVVNAEEIDKLDTYMNDGHWKCLGSGITARKGNADESIGKFLSSELNWSISNVFLAGHIGSIFYKAGIWGYNGKSKGIQFRKIRDNWRELLKAYYLKQIEKTILV